MHLTDKTNNFYFQNKDISPKKRLAPKKQVEDTSSSSSDLTDEDIDVDSSDNVAESLPPPQLESDLDSLEMDENSVNTDDDTSTTVSTNQSIPASSIKHGKGDRNKKHESPEREVFYFYGASGKVISYGHSIHISMKGKQKR